MDDWLVRMGFVDLRWLSFIPLDRWSVRHSCGSVSAERCQFGEAMHRVERRTRRAMGETGCRCDERQCEEVNRAGSGKRPTRRGKG